ncbi:hypothetical protein V6U90_25575 [Micromonospora sp. CPCC 206060]|uniref:hypothetical protein n=1 Tax=Micromonospora sp. CPCC 206060 TaxID=3122406 RepID=UPI002FF0E7AE
MGTPDDPGPRDGGAPDGLPELPPGWGPVVVPDDASALAEEAALVRRELRERVRRGLPPRLTVPPGHPVPGDGRYPTRPSARLPLLVIMLAVLASAAGIFAITLARPARPTARPPVVPAGTPDPAPGRTLPALELTDDRQEPVSLRGLLPAVIILLDGCTCTEQVGSAAAAVPAGVSVVTVVSDGRVPAPAGTGVRSLGDPAGALRAFLQLPARPGTATALLVDRSGQVVRVVPEVGPAEEYRADLDRLG